MSAEKKRKAEEDAKEGSNKRVKWKDAVDVSQVRTPEQQKEIETEAAARKVLLASYIDDIKLKPQRGSRFMRGADGHHYRTVNRLPPGCSRESFLRQLPALFALPVGSRYHKQLVQVAQIPEGFVPAVLVNQWGLQPKSDLKAFTVLGVYEGSTRLDPVDVKQTPVPLPRSSILLETVAAPRELPADELSFGMSLTLKGVTKEFTISAVEPFGNGAMERVNDFRADVCVDSSTAPNDPSLINCDWITVAVDGEPFVVVVTTKPVTKKDWFAHHYGNDYWAPFCAKKNL